MGLSTNKGSCCVILNRRVIFGKHLNNSLSPLCRSKSLLCSQSPNGDCEGWKLDHAPFLDFVIILIARGASHGPKTAITSLSVAKNSSRGATKLDSNRGVLNVVRFKSSQDDWILGNSEIGNSVQFIVLIFQEFLSMDDGV